MRDSKAKANLSAMTQDVPPQPLGPRSPLPRSARTLSLSQSPPPSQHAGPSSPRPKAKPLGPRSPPGSFSDMTTAISSPPPSQNPDRHRAGSSRTNVYTGRTPASPDAPISDEPLDEAQSLDVEVDAPHAPYRPPEAVIEPVEEPPHGYFPGVVEGHRDDDDFELPQSPLQNVYDMQRDTADIDLWQTQVRSYPDSRMEVDETHVPERPHIGPGVFPRRWLKLVHEHELLQPQIGDLPQPLAKKVPPPTAPSLTPVPTTATLDNLAPASPLPSRSSLPIAPSLPDYERICTTSDVWDSCPGGEQGHNEWYFCGTCWGWIRIVSTHGAPPEVEDMDAWETTVRHRLAEGIAYPGIATVDDLPPAKMKRYAELGRYNDIRTSYMTYTGDPANHLHEFQTLLHPTLEKRIERITSDHPNLNEFPHLSMGVAPDPTWDTFNPPTLPPRLFVSCASDWWIQVDDGLIAGQLPRALTQAFSSEKFNNPGPGINPKDSVAAGWYMLALLLGNALFRGQRGWVSLNNARFQRSVGMSEVVSVMLYYLGFGCRQETDTLRVGPYSKGENISASDIQHMDRYMMRVWLEMQTYLTDYQGRFALDTIGPSSITVKPLESLWPELSVARYPKMLNGYPAIARESCYVLGCSFQDVADTIEKAYDFQITCDAENTSKYLAALQIISDQPVAGKEGLQMKLVLERSMGKYTSDDVDAAYSMIGYTSQYAEEISVPPDDAPPSHIYDLHKKATQAAPNYSERSALGKALALIGKHRKLKEMENMGNSGQTMMSVEEAYNALSAPRDAVDDGLIMQYEMAVNEYPGKKEHYRSCLSIIAAAPDEERPAIQTFLDTGALFVAPPPRQDIPVGLQNIGNTCYLNSILQYLYSIRPLREAVMNFEQDLLEFKPRKAEAERSRRFVRQLRLLFLQLYKSESSSVRPDEELAYLAITRPEVDAIVAPPIIAEPAYPTLDSIPDMPENLSPSSTRVATPTTSRPYTPELSPEIVDNPPFDPTAIDDEQFGPRSSGSILGKRQSQDRDSFSDTSPAERARYKSEGVELNDPPLSDPLSEDYEIIKADSPSAVTDLADLSLLTPAEEQRAAALPEAAFVPPVLEHNPQTPLDGDFEMYEPPAAPPPLPARPMARRDSTLASGLRFGLQQDSAEVLINVLSQLELAFDPSVGEGEEPGRNIISELFSCKYEQQMFFEAAEGSFLGQAPVESVFVHPIIGVEEEGKDLYDCLGELYLRGSEIEYEGKKGYIMDLMDRFPPLLYIQMRYDIATGRERKTNTHIPFGQTLQMDRFLATAKPEKRDISIRLTRTMTDTRAQLHLLRDRKPLSMTATFTHVREALAQIQDMPELDITPDFLDALEAEEKRVAGEIEQLQTSLVETKAKLDEVWKDEREMEYELVSVFMHRGKTSGAGHYWTYQAHLPDIPDNSEKFFKYNDETVTEVPASEILQDRTGDDANPALLCYVRKGQNLVETLHREILERRHSLGSTEAGDDGAQVDEGIVMMEDGEAEKDITLF